MLPAENQICGQKPNLWLDKNQNCDQIKTPNLEVLVKILIFIQNFYFLP